MRPAARPPTTPTTIPSTGPTTARQTLAWRALAGSLDDLGFTPPPATATSAADDPDELGRAPTSPPELTLSGHPRARQFSRAAVTVIVLQIVLTLVIVSGFTIQLYDKAVIAPGTTADIEEFVDVRDHPAYASDASISLVSVRTSFAPSLFEVVGGWLDGALEVVDIDRHPGRAHRGREP